MLECQRCKLTHGVLHASCNDKVLGLVMLEHQPHAFHIVLGISPIAFAIQIAQL